LNLQKGEHMYDLSLRVTDKDCPNLMVFLKESWGDVEILANNKLDAADSDEFKIDVDYCLKMADKIKSGDLSGFKEVTPDELIAELKQ
jgi:hypothetical protein